MSSNYRRSRNKKIKHRRAPCIISRELVDSAFAYQREIVEMRFERSKMLEGSDRNETITTKTAALKQENIFNILRIQELELKLKEAKARNAAENIKIQELTNLALSLLRLDIPSDIMLRCRQVIRDSKGVPNPYIAKS